MAEIKSRYEEIYAHCATTPNWFIHQADPRKTMDVPPEEREAFWEQLYGEPGFGIWMGNFPNPDQRGRQCRDQRLYREKNLPAGEGCAVADELIPKDHGFGTRRVPLKAAISKPTTATT